MPEPDQAPAPPSVGRAVAVYTGLRVLLFLIVALLALAVVRDPLLAVGIGVLGSALLAIPLLKPYRADLNAAAAARAERRQASRARLDET